MKRIFTSALCVASFMLMGACSTPNSSQQAKTVAHEPTQVQIDQVLHFSSPDETDVAVQPGKYRFEQASDTQLRLLSSADAPPIILSAHAASSTSDVPSPIALGTLFESEVYHLILLMPGNRALESHGTVSGVQSRGGFDRNLIFMKANKLVVQPTQPQPRPDLVPTCLRVEQINLVFQQLYFVHAGVSNQGTVAAGQSQTKYGPVTTAVPGLQPGQFQPIVFSFGVQSPPSSSLQVDSGNQVPESNEQNNVTQKWC